MIQCVIAAPSSNSGKTVVTTALLALLKRKGYDPAGFKCGPDYIDPMFHRAVLGIDSHNLDAFLSDNETVEKLYGKYSAGHGASVVEGVMGFYDGLGGTTDRASTWHIADILNLPVILVVAPKGNGYTLAALIKGIQTFRENSHIAGIIMNSCSESLYQVLSPVICRETGIPVLGYLPHMKGAEFPSRHLGLFTADELKDWDERIKMLADNMEQHIDFEALKEICERPVPEMTAESENDPKDDTHASETIDPIPRIAVARDEAFCFTYAEGLDCIKEQGAELVFFSPVKDENLPPDIDGLYLPGGYPELYAKELSENRSMREGILHAVRQGMPTVAECGGFLYLGKTLMTGDGDVYEMVGAFDYSGEPKGKLVRFGYSCLHAKESDSLLLKQGEQVPIHEFHHWDTDANGTDFTVTKPLGKRTYSCGYADHNLFAAFPHLYFAGTPILAKRLVFACRDYKKNKSTTEE